MPFVKRSQEGRIIALFDAALADADEFLDAAHPDVVAFLHAAPVRDALSSLAASDQEMARVTEDVIDLLISKNLILFTDLPDHAQRKLLKRKELRSSSALDLGLLGEGEII